jgi:hypothetical protein
MADPKKNQRRRANASTHPNQHSLALWLDRIRSPPPELIAQEAPLDPYDLYLQWRYTGHVEQMQDVAIPKGGDRTPQCLVKHIIEAFSYPQAAQPAMTTGEMTLRGLNFWLCVLKGSRARSYQDAPGIDITRPSL